MAFAYSFDQMNAFFLFKMMSGEDAKFSLLEIGLAIISGYVTKSVL
jgi:hypothetical protein